MPAIDRKRRVRRKELTLPTRALFDVGCGHAAIGDDAFRALWLEHGAGYLARHSNPENTWGFICWGHPDDLRPEAAEAQR